jgi:hypothetical protein
MSSKYGRSYLILAVGLVSLTVLSIIPKLATSAPAATSYTTSWLGNTFGGGSQWVQNNVYGMHVAPDGTVYTNSRWDESGREAGIYKDGKVIGRSSELHGWGRLGGPAITVGGKYVYLSMSQEQEGVQGQDYPPKETVWYAVRRYTLSGAPAPFAGGRGYDKSMLIVSKSKHDPSTGPINPILGLASANNELYVSDKATNQIRVYSTDTMTELRSWSFSRPGQITVDRRGDLWIVQAKDDRNPPKILHYSKTGTPLPEKITDVIDPTALAVDKQGRLLVAENGPRQQVLIYRVAGAPKLVGTFGKEGGIYSDKRGEVGDLKFYGITGIGADAGGNLYVNSNGFSDGVNGSGTDLRKFSPSGALAWQLHGLAFVDNADVDPSSDGTNVFTKHEHFVMDYSKGSGKEWKYKAYTLDKFRYPDDPRLHREYATAFVRRIGGQRFLYLTDMYASHLAVFRFDGEIAVPCLMFAKEPMKNWPNHQPESSGWIWRDRNGDGSIQKNEYESLGAGNSSIWGWEIDSKGDVWQASTEIIRYRQQGLDSHGTPLYTREASEVVSVPSPFDKVERIKYFPDTDVMYLAGYTSDRPNAQGDWGRVGREIVRYDRWSKDKNVRWRLTLPFNPANNLSMKAMDVAGDRVFAVDSKTAAVYAYSAAEGNSVAKITPGPEVNSESGWVDIPYGIRAYQKSNGEYLVFVEEDAKGKVIMYRYKA